MTYCGYVALLGKPNAGKSTLMNALLGAKIAGVSAKAQTTRARILGVYTEGEYQLILVDTPGVHTDEGLSHMNRMMNRAAWVAVKDADVVCYLVDGSTGWDEEDTKWFRALVQKHPKNLGLMITKQDKVQMHIIDQNAKIAVKMAKDILAGHEGVHLLNPFPYLISSKRPLEVQGLRKWMYPLLPESPWFFDADDMTDRPQKVVCAELIQEQIFRQLGQELPYSCGVRVDEMRFGKKVVEILATIVVQKPTHKAIVIGKGGARLRQLGTASRESLEKHLGTKVFLELFVKVQEKWVENESFIAEFAGLKE